MAYDRVRVGVGVGDRVGVGQGRVGRGRRGLGRAGWDGKRIAWPGLALPWVGWSGGGVVCGLVWSDRMRMVVGECVTDRNGMGWSVHGTGRMEEDAVLQRIAGTAHALRGSQHASSHRGSLAEK